MIHFSVLGILMVKLDNIFLLLSSFYSFKINTSLTMKSRFEGYGGVWYNLCFYFKCFLKIILT